MTPQSSWRNVCSRNNKEKAINIIFITDFSFLKGKVYCSYKDSILGVGEEMEACAPLGRCGFRHGNKGCHEFPAYKKVCTALTGKQSPSEKPLASSHF